MFIFEILKAFLMGIVEGVTEWLPISSTGHMILLEEILKINASEEFLQLLLVVIQLGAIMAVPVIYWNKIDPFAKGGHGRDNLDLWLKVIVASLPAALFGFLFDDFVGRYLYNHLTVALALIIYGLVFIFIEKNRAEQKSLYRDTDDISYFDSLKIGMFQALSLVPGTSRSGATMIGGMICGLSRTASAEFSFFMAIPIMLGASFLKVLKYFLQGLTLDAREILILAVGIIVSFVVSLFTIRFLVDFVKKRGFPPFGYYRIFIGVLVFAYYFINKGC